MAKKPRQSTASLSDSQNSNVGISSLISSLEGIDKLFRNNIEVGHFLLRELASRLLSEPASKSYLLSLQENWPRWTKQTLMQANLLSIAREHGDFRSFVEIYISLNQKRPDDRIIPLKAWTMFNTWLSEGGYQKMINLPAWVWEYFSKAAYNIQKVRADWKHKEDNKSKFSSLIANALIFTSVKSNVFVADYTDFINTAAYVFWCDYRDKGLKGDALISAVQNLTGDADSRTTRKRIAKGKSAAADWPWPNSKANPALVNQ